MSEKKEIPEWKLELASDIHARHREQGCLIDFDFSLMDTIARYAPAYSAEDVERPVFACVNLKAMLEGEAPSLIEDDCNFDNFCEALKPFQKEK